MTTARSIPKPPFVITVRRSFLGGREVVVAKVTFSLEDEAVVLAYALGGRPRLKGDAFSIPAEALDIAQRAGARRLEVGVQVVPGLVEHYSLALSRAREVGVPGTFDGQPEAWFRLRDFDRQPDAPGWPWAWVPPERVVRIG